MNIFIHHKWQQKIKIQTNNLNKQRNKQCIVDKKDNKKWCDLANLTNVYNSDTIHHYMVDNKSQTFITDTCKYRYETDTRLPHVRQAH